MWRSHRHMVGATLAGALGWVRSHRHMAGAPLAGALGLVGTMGRVPLLAGALVGV